jgi:hypothetical protein
MALTVATVIAGAVLGGGVAADVTALVALAAVTLVVIAAINGTRIAAALLAALGD